MEPLIHHQPCSSALPLPLPPSVSLPRAGRSSCLRDDRPRTLVRARLFSLTVEMKRFRFHSKGRSTSCFLARHPQTCHVTSHSKDSLYTRKQKPIVWELFRTIFRVLRRRPCHLSCLPSHPRVVYA